MSELSNHLEIEGLTLFTAPPEPHLHDVHAHNAYSIIVLTSGNKQFHHCGTTTQIDTHQIAIANPNELHGCGPIEEQPWSHRTWYMSEELMAEIADSLGIEGPVHLRCPAIRDESIAQQLIAAHEQCDDGEVLDNQVTVLEALERLVREYAEEKPAPLTVEPKQVKKRMAIYTSALQAKLGQTTDLSELAKLAGVKRNQVIRDFRQSINVTPGVYLRQLRLDHAKQLIQSGKDLTSTSLEAGFADQSHFTRSFKKAFGVTPKHFRNLSIQSGGKSPL